MTTNTHILWRHPKGQPHAGAPCPESIVPDTEMLYPLRGKVKPLDIEKWLIKNSLLKLVGDHSEERITCLSGVVWITQPGDLEDIVLSTGEAFTITQKGTILIEGLAESRLKITGRSVKKQGLSHTHVSLPGYKG